MSNTKVKSPLLDCSGGASVSARGCCGTGSEEMDGLSSEQLVHQQDDTAGEQLDFDQLWADSLREKYGISKPIQ